MVEIIWPRNNVVFLPEKLANEPDSNDPIIIPQ